jgi:hypothetical protein
MMVAEFEGIRVPFRHQHRIDIEPMNQEFLA